ncbi:MAG: 30S ribosomal protein S12 methylthiotransferase RimO [Flavobacteriales bacterium]|nr:MAG: 30S ribosomal protein S12 methylthiotransferase RimO [Flavobacteriales bacterium]
MKTKTIHKPTVNVITLGCSKNIYDSEVLMAQLKASKFEVSHESESKTDIAIINTCGFIENAKQESIDAILEYAEEKKSGNIDKLIVTGCLSERYAGDLKQEIPEVDSWFGTKDLPRLLKTLKADYKQELVGERLLTTPSHYAYFKISEGCDRKCSFCAIPLMRGKHLSFTMEELVTRAENLASKGVKELILIAQDLTFYGLDIYGKRVLSELLRKLSDVEGIEWIRLHYAFPSGFPMDVLDVIRERENICNYLDMPLQHISDDLLKSMRRGTTREKTNRLIETIHEKVPDLALRTTLICGYPGETKQHFEELCEWVQKTQFDRLGVFSYSHEEDTHAFGLKDDVAHEVKQERMEKIMEIQSGISYELNQQKIGKTIKVLIDREEGDYLIGRTEHDSPEVDNEVLIPLEKGGELNAQIGQFAMVKITSAEQYDLLGQVIS